MSIVWQIVRRITDKILGGSRRELEKILNTFFFHFVDHIRMDFGNADKFSCTLKN